MSAGGDPRRGVVTLGEAMLRLTAPAGTRLRGARELRAHVAGSEANVARALAALGVPVSWISALPVGPLADGLLDELRGAGVDTTHVQRSARGRLGLFFAETGAAPRPGRVLYDRSGSSFALMEELDERALAGARYAIVSGVTPALGARSRRLTERFVRAARAAGARVCIDVNFRRLLWSPARARQVLAPLLAEADLVVCSRRDARELFGAEGEAAQMAAAFAARWAPRADAVAVTLGDAGSVLCCEQAVLEQSAGPVELVDRFGAGDAFLAGLVFGRWSGHPWRRALREASALAALACTVEGDAAAFDPAELAAALEPAQDGGILR